MWKLCYADAKESAGAVRTAAAVWMFDADGPVICPENGNIRGKSEGAFPLHASRKEEAAKQAAGRVLHGDMRESALLFSPYAEMDLASESGHASEWVRRSDRHRRR